MAEKSFRNRVMLAKIESVYGEDSNPSGALNAIQVVDLQVRPYNAQSVQRNLSRPFMGAQPRKQVGKHVTISGRIELAGAGGVGGSTVIPGYDPVFRIGGLARTQVSGANGTIAASPPKPSGTPTGAFTYTRTAAYTGNRRRTVTLTCTTGGASGVAAFTVSAPAAGSQGAYNQAGVVMTDAMPFAIGGAATITPAVVTPFVNGDVFTIEVSPPRVSYTPISSAFESASVYCFYDGILHKGLGARAELGVMIESGIPYVPFTINGLFVTPVDDTMPAVDFSAFQDPLVAEKSNVPVCSLHGYNGTLQRLELQFGNQNQPRILVNQEKIPISAREIAGRMVMEMDDLSAMNWFDKASSGAPGPLAFQIGDAAGQIARVDSPRVQIETPDYGDDRDTLMINSNVVLLPTDAGNDEIEISVL